MEANDPRDVTNLDPTGMVSRIYVGDHLILQNTKYIGSGPHGFRGEDFESSLAIEFDINK